MAVKALVVDNNPVLLRAISVILEQEGCEVFSVKDGLEALEYLKENIPDVVFTDLVMPHVDGEQLCRIIRKNKMFKKVFLVVISGILLEDLENIREGNLFDLCIAKGNLKELREHLRYALQQMETREHPGEALVDSDTPKIPKGLKPSSITTELLSEKRHLDHILASLEEGIIEFNQEGIVISLNNSVCSILNETEESLIGRYLGELDWRDHLSGVNSWLKRNRTGEGNESYEILDDLPLIVGQKVITASFNPVKDKTGIYGLCILRDITRQYRAEEHEKQLDEAIDLIAKMDALSYMAGGIAHDFNNLLAVICGNLDMLVHPKSYKDGGQQKRLLEHARTAAYLAVELTRKISSSSPFGVVTRSNCSLQELVEEAISRFMGDFNAHCEYKYSERDFQVSVDSEQIIATFINILQNSYEAAGDNTISITLKEVQLDEPLIQSGQYVPAGKYGSVVFEDRGDGIRDEHLLKIFDPYFSTKERGASKGMGLGLAVVYATMRNHRGYIVVESPEGKGAVVTCYLPEEVMAAPATVQVKGVESGTQRVLFIEADRQLRDVCKVMVEFCGYKPVLAENVQEGLAMVAEGHGSDSDQIQAVLLSPDVDSLEEHREICTAFIELEKDIKLILTSVQDSTRSDEEYRAAGYHGRIPKPFTLDEMKRVLSSLQV